MCPCVIWHGSGVPRAVPRSEEHTSELQSQPNLVCRLLLEKKTSHRVVLESAGPLSPRIALPDRKSTRLNSSHLVISYAVFCLKKKTELSCTFVRVTIVRFT